MQGLPVEPVFAVGGVDYRWEDVVSAAESWGEWDAVVERTRSGLAVRARATADGEPDLADELNAAATEFRYERDLTTAEEMESWLARWGLDVEEWMTALETRLLSAANGAPDAPELDAGADFDRALLAEAVVSGDLERFARTLAGRIAVFEKLKEEGVVPPESVASDAAAREAAFERFRDSTVTAAALADRVRARSSDWTRVDCRVLVLPREEMGREAVLSIREDGAALHEVAAAAKGAVEERRIYLEDLDPEVRDRLWAARPGELVGPLRSGEGFALFSVVGKSLPSLEDEDVRRRAEESLLGGLVRREVEDRVTWRWTS